MDQLPANAPLQDIQRYLELDQRSRGELKTNAALMEQKRNVEFELIKWLENPQNQPFLKVGDQWCEVDDSMSKVSITDDLLESSYVIFHKAGNHNRLSVDDAAKRFVHFVRDATIKLGKSQRKLKWGKTRPKLATRYALQQLGNM